MTHPKLLGLRQYRRFMRWAAYFMRVMPWLWFGGIGALLAVSVFNLEKRYGVNMGVICAFTIWPAILGWLAITGFGIVWRFALGVFQAVHRKQRPNSLALIWSVSLLAAGVVFLGGAAMVMSALLKHALASK